MAVYVPKQGDFVALNFDPQSGHEQQGRRPALVISKDAFNLGTGMAVCCPITNKDRSIPFHVPLADRTGLTGFVMCEQMKALDYRSRKLKFIAAAPLEVLEDVLAIVDASIFD